MAERHAILRARERYGLELTDGDLVRAGLEAPKEGVLIARQENGGSIWMMKIKGIVCRIVLSKMGNVITFLPANARLAKWRM